MQRYPNDEDEQDTIRTACHIPTEAISKQKAVINSNIADSTKSPLQNKFINKKEDRRIAIKESTTWPYSAIGLIFIRFKNMRDNEYLFATGTLIMPYVVLTSAHNLYTHNSHLGEKIGEAVHVEFHPGSNIHLTYASSVAEKVYISEAFKNDISSPEDYAIIVLTEPLGDRCGYFGLNVCPSIDIEAMNLDVTGYPADKVKDKRRIYEMWGMKGKSKLIDNNHIIYDEVDAYDGQNGGAVWFQEENGECYIVGVHIGYNETASAYQAVLITMRRYEQIMTWVDEYLTSKFSSFKSNVTIIKKEKVVIVKNLLKEIDTLPNEDYKYKYINILIY